MKNVVFMTSLVNTHNIFITLEKLVPNYLIFNDIQGKRILKHDHQYSLLFLNVFFDPYANNFHYLGQVKYACFEYIQFNPYAVKLKLLMLSQTDFN